MAKNAGSTSSGVPSEDKNVDVVRPEIAHLSEQEREIITRQTDAPNLTVSYFSLFRYANKVEILIMLVSLLASIGAGATMPLMTVRFVTRRFEMG